MAKSFGDIIRSWSSYSPFGGLSQSARAAGGSTSLDKNLQNSVVPIQLMRVVQTIGNWRAGTIEAELAYLPFRVKQQQLYNDLQDEPHLASCIERRMDLTLMRDFGLFDRAGKENEQWTQWLKEQEWFIDFQRYVLGAKFRGYSLISLGDIVNNTLPELKLIEHSVISPDRNYVGSVVYSASGINWDDEPYNKWHIWVKTPPEIGRGVCGYGILHKVAVATIILRNNLSDNATYNEKFGMPVTHGKTDKTDDERADFYRQLKQMGASATFVTDMLDEINFIESGGSGQGFKTYADLEKRCQQLISKAVLGHGDVMDSIPKRSGASEGNSSTPTTVVSEALSNIRVKDGKFVMPYVNKMINLLRSHGVGMPEDLRFDYKNDEEVEEAKRVTAEYNKSIVDIAKTMKDAGLQPSPEWFTETTGIPCETVTPPAPQTKGITPSVQNKLNSLYGHKH